MARGRKGGKEERGHLQGVAHCSHFSVQNTHCQLTIIFLFLVGDTTFLLLRTMETAVRRILSTKMIPTGSIMEQTKTAVLNDPAVLAHWHHIVSVSQPMHSSTSDNLLEEITEKWATLRGHSFAAGLVEQYQSITGEY